MLEAEQRAVEAGHQNDIAAQAVSRVFPPHSPDAEAWRRLEALRTQKKAEDVRRKRVTLTRTLAGNPGQLSLFS